MSEEAADNQPQETEPEAPKKRRPKREDVIAAARSMPTEGRGGGGEPHVVSPPDDAPVREASAPHVYTAINDVKAQLARMGGITKNNQTNYGDRYQFRGIDDMYNVLCSITVRAGLVMIPRVVESKVEREPRTRGDGHQTHVFLTVEVDYISTVDGSKHTGRYFGEAIDTSDKASNKAMSGAMKYACLMAFQIPTDGRERDDIEYENHEVGMPAPPPKPQDSAKALDAAMALTERVKSAETFEGIFGICLEAEKINLEPHRGALFERIREKTRDLIEKAPDLKTLQSSKSLIQQLGSPEPLMKAYGAVYSKYRQPKPSEVTS